MLCQQSNRGSSAEQVHVHKRKCIAHTNNDATRRCSTWHEILIFCVSRWIRTRAACCGKPYLVLVSTCVTLSLTAAAAVGGCEYVIARVIACRTTWPVYKYNQRSYEARHPAPLSLISSVLAHNPSSLSARCTRFLGAVFWLQWRCRYNRS